MIKKDMIWHWITIRNNKKKVKCNEQDYRESLQKHMKQNKEIIAANEQLISQYISQI